jgi:transcriptional antiterminator RfaH
MCFINELFNFPCKGNKNLIGIATVPITVMGLILLKRFIICRYLIYKKKYICTMNWYAIYTKPRNEKKVADKLEALGIEAYCPMVTSVKQWSDRKKKVSAPVLPSYVFVKLTETRRNEVFAVPGVVRYVFWLGKPAIIREAEIAVLKEYLLQDYTLVVHTTLQRGDKLIVSSGPFKGQEGVIKNSTNSKIQLVLESLGILLTLEK